MRGLALRALAAAPLVLTALYLGVAARQPESGLALCVMILLAVAAGPRLHLQLVGRTLVLALLVGLILVWGRTFPLLDSNTPTQLSALWLAAGSLGVLGAAARLATVNPPGGALGTAAYGLAALVCAGQCHGGARYGALAALHLLLLLLALRMQDSSRPRWGQIPRALRVAAALVLGTALAAAVLLAAPLKPLSRWIEGRFEDSYSPELTRVGFQEHLRLGELQRVLDSPRPVLRLTGPPTDYLRGGVYNRYQNRFWTGPAISKGRTQTLAKGPLLGADVVQAEVLGQTNGCEALFLPLGLRELATRSGQVLTLPLGALRPPQGSGDTDSGAVLWFRQSGLGEVDELGPRRLAPLGGQEEDDLQMPVEIRPALTALVTEWLAGARAQDATNDALLKLARIEQHLLSDYHYATSFERRAGHDPVLEFLQHDKRGHCEYFAAAMVLLARAAGVPARLVGGYRVAEHNPLGNYYVVRERNAHAWVEALVPGRGWQSFDPTPGDGPPANRPYNTSLGAALPDYLLQLGGRGWEWLLLRGPRVLGGPLFAVVVAGLMLRALQQRRLRRRQKTLPLRPGEAPLPGFVLLEAALRERGQARAPHEPLEVFAERLRPTADAAAAGLLLRYAALRYGVAAADAEGLDGSLRALAARLRQGGGEAR